MEPVGQLDDDDPRIPGHGDEHLAEGGRLLRLPGVEPQPVELGDPVHDARHDGPEVALEIVQDDTGVLHRVVQEGGGDGDVVQAQLAHDGGHRRRVVDVGLPRAPLLTLVGHLGDLEGPHHQGGVGLGVVGVVGGQHGRQGGVDPGDRGLPAPGEHPVDGGHLSPPTRPGPGPRPRAR